MSVNLTPCPFCSNERLYTLKAPPSRSRPASAFVVVCDRCGCSGPEATVKSAAQEKWNQRPVAALVGAVSKGDTP